MGTRSRFAGRVTLPGAFVGHPLEFDSVGGEVSVLHDGGVLADPVQQRGGHLAVLLQFALRLLLPRGKKPTVTTPAHTAIKALDVAQIGRVTNTLLNQVRHSLNLLGRGNIRMYS